MYVAFIGQDVTGRHLRLALILAGTMLLAACAGLSPAGAGGGPQLATSLDPRVSEAGTPILIADADGLAAFFAEQGYELADVRDEGRHVPRVLVAELPDDMKAIESSSLRKSLFLSSMLPHVLMVNEQVLADRARLEAIARDGADDPDSQAFLARLAADYRLDEPDIDALLARVDVVPPSMALAQAAVESGWGTSGLAREDNAVFGQIAGSPDGRYAAFTSLAEATRSYVRNLNTHPAYADFRERRAAMRRAGEPLDGHALMAGLTAYSELGGEYIAYIRKVMRANELERIDVARLMDHAVTTIVASL